MATLWSPILGPLKLYEVSAIVGGVPWYKFNTGIIHGLVRVRERRVDLLAVAAWHPSMGDFAKFLDQLQGAYDTIGVWEIMNPALGNYLARRGFERREAETIHPEDGETTSGYLWVRQSWPR